LVTKEAKTIVQLGQFNFMNGKELGWIDKVRLILMKIKEYENISTQAKIIVQIQLINSLGAN